MHLSIPIISQIFKLRPQKIKQVINICFEDTISFMKTHKLKNIQLIEINNPHGMAEILDMKVIHQQNYEHLTSLLDFIN